MKIRRATLDDAGGIAAIHVRSWQAGYQGIVPEAILQSLSIERREKIWRENLQKPSAVTWVAEDVGRLLGWISAGSSRDEDADPQTGELWAIYVDPEAWRCGVGKALWQAAEAHLRQEGFQSVTLWVLSENQRGLRFYETLGFSVDGDRENTLDFDGVKVPEIRLRRALHSELT